MLTCPYLVYDKNLYTGWWKWFQLSYLSCAYFIFPSLSPISSQECAFVCLKSTTKEASKADGIVRMINNTFFCIDVWKSSPACLPFHVELWHWSGLFLSGDFLLNMRDYMPPSHKAFIEAIQSAPSLRDHVLSSGNGPLLTAYNQCVQALAELRSYHITMVTKYLITSAAKAKGRKLSYLPGPPQALEDRGTGGTSVLIFLKSVRNKTLGAILPQSG